MSIMEALLEQLYDDLTETALSTNRIYKEAKIPQNYFTYSWKLKRSLRNTKLFLGIKRFSLEQLLQLWIPKWKSEGRLKVKQSGQSGQSGHSGQSITIELNQQESELLGLRGAKEVNIYELFSLMIGLFQY